MREDRNKRVRNMQRKQKNKEKCEESIFNSKEKFAF